MSHFETKKDYLKFITAWKIAANHTKNKKHRKVCDLTQYFGWPDTTTEKQKDEWRAKGYTVNDHSYTIPDGAHYKTSAWLTASHFILRNVLLGKDIKRGFCPKGIAKCGKYEDPWMAFNQAHWNVKRHIIDAKRFVEMDNDKACQTWINEGMKGIFKKTTDRTEDQYYTMIEKNLRWINKFLEPLGAAIDVNDLAKIELEKLEVSKAA